MSYDGLFVPIYVTAWLFEFQTVHGLSAVACAWWNNYRMQRILSPSTWLFMFLIMVIT